MTKRHFDEDDDQNISRASSKRARTVGSDEESDEPVPQTQTRPRRERDRKGKGRAQDDASASEASDDEVNVADFQDEEIDEEEFERIHGDKLRAHLERQHAKKTRGGVADHGVIEYIEMHQFMCHKFLRFTFGPQINFIIGHNGSGKSAVLSAITVALGGKANSTGRGNGLKSFIREGQSVSEVTIHIKNQGEEAFKPSEYGSTIVITRKFTKEGNSSWKIKSKDGKVISTKKDELSAICDHMNIQVDNPMNVLTQDAARQFLSASAPGDKYKFFLRGTQLQQLSEEYDTCIHNIHQTAKLLAVKKEALPDLRARLEEVTARYQEAAKAREQTQKAINLRGELGWAHVAAKKAELEKAIGHHTKLSRRIPKIVESIDKAKAEFDAMTALVTELEAEIGNLESVDHLTTRKTDLMNKIRLNKSKIIDYNAELKAMDTSVKDMDVQIEEFDRRIEEEAQRMAADNQEKREETQRKLEAAKETVNILERKIHDVRSDRQNVSSQAEELKQKGEALNAEKAKTEREIAGCDSMLDSAKQAEKDALIPYGRNIRQILDRIKAMRWVGDAPLGPLGQFVKAKDPKTWGEILRNMMGQYLLAFAVTDARDRAQLKKLLVENGNPHTIIVVYEKDLFDYRGGEPPEHLLTVLRALEISDPYVLRILINQSHIESQILAKTRLEAQKILFDLRGGSAWTLDRMNVRVFPEGGVNSSPLNIRELGGAMNLLLTGRDSVAEVKHINEKRIGLLQKREELIKELTEFRDQYMQLKKNMDQINFQERQLQTDLRAAKLDFTNLTHEANEEMPVGVAGLQEAKQEVLDEKDGIKEQFEHVATEKKKVQEEQHAYQEKLNDVKKLLVESDERRAVLVAKIDDGVAARMKAQNDMKHFEVKLTEERKTVDDAEEAAKILEEEFRNWTDKAAEICPEVDKPRKVEEVQRNLESVTRALREREKQQGASVEVMAVQVNKAEENLRKTEKELKQMTVLNKALRASLMVRLSRWQDFRRHIALRCKQVFQYHLSNRGYYGNIVFNHKDPGSLHLRVQTDDQTLTQGVKDKDPSSLSGGEKSFSTICLLLSLWECIGCPLRCLDEFDVFMDAVNRRISMKMMIETANTSDKKQYILITPQDMANVSVTNSVKVHRMSDPERGEMTM